MSIRIALCAAAVAALSACAQPTTPLQVEAYAANDLPEGRCLYGYNNFSLLIDTQVAVEDCVLEEGPMTRDHYETGITSIVNGGEQISVYQVYLWAVGMNQVGNVAITMDVNDRTFRIPAYQDETNGVPCSFNRVGIKTACDFFFKTQGYECRLTQAKRCRGRLAYTFPMTPTLTGEILQELSKQDSDVITVKLNRKVGPVESFTLSRAELQAIYDKSGEILQAAYVEGGGSKDNERAVGLRLSQIK